MGLGQPLPYPPPPRKNCSEGRIAALWARPEARQAAVAVVIAITAVYSIAYTSIQYVDAENYGGNSDSIEYLTLARGGKIDSPVLFEARALTIWLVKALPDPPSFLFAEGRQVDDEWNLKIRFAAVNSAFLVGAALLLWLYCGQVGMSALESYLGMLLFLTSLTVVYQGAIPLVDPSAFFFIALGMVVIASGTVWLFAVVLAVGLYAKETAVFLVPLALVTVDRKRLWWLAAALPGIAVYVAWRWFVVPEGSGNLGNLDPERVRAAIGGLSGYLSFNRAAEFVSSFGLLWIPALYALAAGKLPARMRRQYLWVALVLAAPILLGTNVGRVWFLAFPVVIPSAVIGVRHILRIPERGAVAEG